MGCGLISVMFVVVLIPTIIVMFITIGRIFAFSCRSPFGLLLLVAVILIVFGLISFLFGQKRHAVCNGDLVVVGVDFGESQKAMAVSAIFHKGRLQRRLNARHFCEIDIAFERFARSAFEIKLFQLAAAGHDNACFLGLAGVDEHFVAHDISLRRQAGFCSCFIPPEPEKRREKRTCRRLWT